MSELEVDSAPMKSLRVWRFLVKHSWTRCNVSVNKIEQVRMGGAPSTRLRMTPPRFVPTYGGGGKPSSRVTETAFEPFSFPVVSTTYTW